MTDSIGCPDEISPARKNPIPFFFFLEMMIREIAWRIVYENHIASHLKGDVITYCHFFPSTVIAFFHFTSLPYTAGERQTFHLFMVPAIKRLLLLAQIG